MPLESAAGLEACEDGGLSQWRLDYGLFMGPPQPHFARSLFSVSPSLHRVLFYLIRLLKTIIFNCIFQVACHSEFQQSFYFSCLGQSPFFFTPILKSRSFSLQFTIFTQKSVIFINYL